MAEFMHTAMLSSATADSETTADQDEANGGLEGTTDKAEPPSKTDKVLADLQNELVRYLSIHLLSSIGLEAYWLA